MIQAHMLAPECMDAIDVIACIENAFQGVVRAETSLRQLLLTDQFGMARHITESEWRAAGKARVDAIWQEIPDAEIEECHGLLAHMNAEEFQYYLPAYMRCAVKRHDETMWGTEVPERTVSSLSPAKTGKGVCPSSIAQYAALNAAQRNAVIVFLTLVAQLDDAMQGHDALEALAACWQQAGN